LFEIESAKVIEISSAGQVKGGPVKKASVPAGMNQGGQQ
jgi:hypothetical protein